MRNFLLMSLLLLSSCGSVLTLQDLKWNYPERIYAGTVSSNEYVGGNEAIITLINKETDQTESVLISGKQTKKIQNGYKCYFIPLNEGNTLGFIVLGTKHIWIVSE